MSVLKMPINVVTKFQDLPVLSVFILNGTTWVKQSSRTAHLWGNPGRWFYFGKNEYVKRDHSK